MALKIINKLRKNKPQIVKTVGNHTVSEYGDLIDAVGAETAKAESIYAQIAELKDHLKDYTDAVSALRKAVAADDTLEEGEDLTLYGEEFYVITKKGSTTRVIKDMQQVRNLMGDDLFCKVAKVTIGSMEKYMPEGDVAKCLDKKRAKRVVGDVKRIL